jgi:hypothetical protein
MHRSAVVYLVHIYAEALAYPCEDSESCAQRSGRDHDRVPHSTRRVAHPPQKLALQDVRVRAGIGGPALGLGAEPLPPALGVHVGVSGSACHDPAVPLQPVRICRNDPLLVPSHAGNASPAPRNHRKMPAPRASGLLAPRLPSPFTTPCPAVRSTAGVPQSRRGGLRWGAYVLSSRPKINGPLEQLHGSASASAPSLITSPLP